MQIFENWIIHKPFLGSRQVPQKIGPDRFRRFDVYLIKTDKQMNDIFFGEKNSAGAVERAVEI